MPCVSHTRSRVVSLPHVPSQPVGTAHGAKVMRVCSADSSGYARFVRTGTDSDWVPFAAKPSEAA